MQWIDAPTISKLLDYPNLCAASAQAHREPLPIIADLYLRILDLILDLHAPDSAGFQFFSPERKKDPKVLISIAYRIQWNSAAQYLERETRLELATPTLARSCSTN